MPQEFVRRDVELIDSQVKGSLAAIDNLRKLDPTPFSARHLALVYTYLENAHLFLKQLAEGTNEKLG